MISWLDRAPSISRPVIPTPNYSNTDAHIHLDYIMDGKPTLPSTRKNTVDLPTPTRTVET